MMLRTLLFSGVLAASALSLASLSPVRAEAALPALPESVKEGTISFAYQGKIVEGRVDSNQGDFADLGTQTDVSVVARLPKDHPVMTVVFGFAFQGDKVVSSEVNLWLRDKKGYFVSRDAKEAPKVTLTKTEKRGGKLFVSGELVATLSFTESAAKPIDPSRTEPIAIKFAAEVGPVD